MVNNEQYIISRTSLRIVLLQKSEQASDVAGAVDSDIEEDDPGLDLERLKLQTIGSPPYYYYFIVVSICCHISPFVLYMYLYYFISNSIPVLLLLSLARHTPVPQLLIGAST